MTLVDLENVGGRSFGGKAQRAAEDCRVEMEELSGRLTDLIRSQPPKDLIGHLWSNWLLYSMYRSSDSIQEEEETGAGPVDRDVISEMQFLLEYVHAVLSYFDQQVDVSPNEEAYHEIQRISERLRHVTMMYCMLSSTGGGPAAFGDKTGEIEFWPKSSWVLLRGNRHQVLEGEFFSFVLEPHDDAFRKVYGAGAKEIASGIQAITDSMRTGHSKAGEEIERHGSR